MIQKQEARSKKRVLGAREKGGDEKRGRVGDVGQVALVALVDKGPGGLCEKGWKREDEGGLRRGFFTHSHHMRFGKIGKIIIIEFYS